MARKHILLAFATTAIVAGGAGAGNAAPVPVTDLSSIVLAKPSVPGPSLEAANISLSQYAIDSGALNETFDPETQRYFIAFPAGITPPRLNTALAAEVVVSRFTRAQLTAAADAITARDWVPGADQYAYGVRVDGKTGTVAVDTTAPPEVTDAIAKKYPGMIRFNHVMVGALQGRTNDSAPHYGGARILATGGPGAGSYCSSGPSVKIGATTYGTTAGHCGDNGTTWVSGPYSFGYTNARPDYPNTDVSRITGSTYNKYIWNGSVSTTSTVTQVGAGDPAGPSLSPRVDRLEGLPVAP